MGYGRRNGYSTVISSVELDEESERNLGRQQDESTDDGYYDENAHFSSPSWVFFTI
jgi:hypothetical protein